MKRVLLYLFLAYLFFACVTLRKDFNTFEPSLLSHCLAFGLMFPLAALYAYFNFVRTKHSRMQKKNLYLRWAITLMFGTGVAMFSFSYLGALNRQFPLQLLDVGKLMAYECHRGSSEKLYRYMRITLATEGNGTSHYYLPYDFCDGSSDLTIVSLLNKNVLIYGHRSVFGTSFDGINASPAAPGQASTS